MRCAARAVGAHVRLLDVGRTVARFAFLHTSDKTRDFLAAWERAMPNPGGGHEVEGGEE
ncbi:MAG: hypothetical protein HZB53_02020 [Chloroflexi bacterium]|nr:hypothetical protein [Chloroflexota bacterium]